MKTEEITAKTYNVSRYFDDVFEAVVENGLTEDEARAKAQEWNDKKPRAYVQYTVRRDPKHQI